jgi:hypothetical protein
MGDWGHFGKLSASLGIGDWGLGIGKKFSLPNEFFFLIPNT